MKKLLSIILALTLILPCISVFALNVAAKSEFSNLWNEKVAYEKDKDISYGEDNMYSLTYAADYSFILFTKQRDKLTYTVQSHVNDGSSALSWYWYSQDELNTDSKKLVSKELYNIVASNQEYEFESGIIAKKSEFRHVVKTLGISYDELKTAFNRMKNETDYVREIFSYMTDDEFADFSDYLKSLPTPQDFVLKAACMENDDMAEALLASPGNVYIKERRMTFSCISLFRNSDLTVEEICNFDLTTKSFIKFISDMENTIDKFGNEWKDEEGRTPKEKYDLVAAEQEKQIANPKTGENIIFLPVAAVALTLGVFAIFPRKKRRFE